MSKSGDATNPQQAVDLANAAAERQMKADEERIRRCIEELAASNRDAKMHKSIDAQNLDEVDLANVAAERQIKADEERIRRRIEELAAAKREAEQA